jgi:hypothetical protein
MASGKRKRDKSKNKPRKSRLSRRPPGNRVTEHGDRHLREAAAYRDPAGYTAPDELDARSFGGAYPALEGYGSDDQIPVVITGPDDPKPRNAGAYIGQANKTLMMTDRESGQEIPAEPGSRMYLRTSGPEAGIDQTVRVGDLTAMEQIPARVITEVAADDTLGLQAGDVIAERQPVGYTDREGQPVYYTDTHIDLPPTGLRGDAPPGSKVWRAEHAPPGTAIRGGDVKFPALRQEYPLGLRRQDPAPPPMVPASGTPEREEFLRRMESGSPGLAARLAQGLSPEELTQLGPEIVRAMGGSGAGGKPELVITDSLEDVPEGDGDELVIEDLDAYDDDAGRLMIGSRRQAQEYHRRVRAADARAVKLLPAMKDDRDLIRSFDAATAVRVRKNWTADEVLDMHAWLTRAYRDPSGDLADYLAWHIRQSVDNDHHTQSLFWPVDVSRGADTAEGRQMAQIIARGLDDSRTFQVTAPMVHKMRDDWIARPGGLLTLGEGILPVPAGFAWLDAPWLSEKLSEGIWLPVRAVSWERTLATVRSSRERPYAPPGVSTADAVRVVLWLLIPDDVAFGRWRGAEKRADKVANKVGRLVPQQIALLPFGIRVDTARRASTEGKELMSLIHTLWTTLAEKLPKSRPLRPSAPAVRQRVQRSLKHGTVQIIPLREYEYVSEGNGHFPQARNWTCRWWVEEFHRHIDPYDDGTDENGRRLRHKAVPSQRSGTLLDDDHDICAVCLANGQTIRISLVHQFAKGPTDKPFKVPAAAKKRTVWKLKR